MSTSPAWFTLLFAALLAVIAPAALPQKGDPGDAVLKKLNIPPAPPLTPAEAMKTFKLPKGYRVELVAAEPLVVDPVAAHFDADGRLWVVEMRGFMPNPEGKGEKEPNGRIVVLEDTKGTGQMDRSTVFLDKLVLPRSVCPLPDGVLVSEAGKLWFCRSTKGDLKCDEKTLVGPFGGGGNPEHDANALMPALDNWIYNANHALRYRRVGDTWTKEPTVNRGQWGLTQDDAGRLFYNSNSSLLRGDFVPCYSSNAHSNNAMTNQAIYTEQEVWPSRITPGINRVGQLRPDGTLHNVTAACGPVIFRGDNLPEDARGNAFICEPAANLIRRNVFTHDKNGKLSSKNVYTKAEFFTSTDERFRPVNLENGPDGALYIVDMYRGLIQHKAYLTPFLKNQAIARGLDKPLSMGRIYRVVHESSTPRPAVRMSQLKTPELVDMLSDRNGWRRDQAQLLLVAQRDKAAKALLNKVLEQGKEPLGRLHALWTLEGLNRLDQDSLLAGLADKDVQVRASAVFLSARLLKATPDKDVLRALGDLGTDTNPEVRMQLVFTLGMVKDVKAATALEPMFKAAAEDPNLLETLLSGFAGRESEFLAACLESPTWEKQEPWRVKLLTASARMLNKQRFPLPMMRLLHLVASQPEKETWRQIALLDGLTAAPAKGDKNPGKVIKLPAPSESLDKLLKSPDARVKSAAEKVAKQLLWPGKDGKPLPVPPPLSAAHKELYEIGKREYVITCAVCHHPAGYGEAGKGPPLLDSDWLRGGDGETKAIRLVLHGLRGPITLNREVFNKDDALNMPALGQTLDDTKTAAVLTYLRREFGDFASPVEPATVMRIRAATAGRTEQWTEAELKKKKGK